MLLFLDGECGADIRLLFPKTTTKVHLFHLNTTMINAKNVEKHKFYGQTLKNMLFCFVSLLFCRKFALAFAYCAPDRQLLHKA